MGGYEGGTDGEEIAAEGRREKRTLENKNGRGEDQKSIKDVVDETCWKRLMGKRLEGGRRKDEEKRGWRIKG